jgi:cobalt-zinc-cadmium efflux system protein
MPHDHGPHTSHADSHDGDSPRGHEHHGHDDHGHDHHAHDHHAHGHAHAPSGFGGAFAIGTALNTLLVTAQVIVGLSAHSMALLADAVHNAGDVLALLLAWGAMILGRRMPSARRTYGWGRGSILAALFNAAVLLVGIGAIAVEAIRRFAEPAAVETGPVVWVALAGIAINGVTAWLFARGQHDLNIRAAFVHMAGDAAVSLGVVVAALAIGLTGALWLDPLTSLAIVVVIAASTWGVLREAAHLAMDGVPRAITTTDVEAYLRSLPGVVEVHDLHIWGLSTTETALTAHLVHTSPPGDDLVLTACRGLNERFRIGHATLQVETERLAEACRLRPAHVV